MKPLYVAVLGFFCGVIAALLGLAALAIVGLQAEGPSAAPPAFVEYPELPKEHLSEAYEIRVELAKPQPLSPEQKQAVEHAYQMIEKVEQADEYARKKGD